jgi:hypothetical protein
LRDRERREAALDEAQIEEVLRQPFSSKNRTHALSVPAGARKSQPKRDVVSSGEISDEVVHSRMIEERWRKIDSEDFVIGWRTPTGVCGFNGCAVE